MDNFSDSSLDTPLHIAVKINAKAEVEILLNCGANVSIKNHRSETPLDIAVRQNLTEVAEILLTSIANRKLVIEKNPSVFDNVMNRANDKMLNLFLQKFSLIELIQTGNVAFVKLFLKSGSNVSTATESGEIPLHYAIERKFEPLANLLLDYEADAKSKDINGLSVIHKAVMYDTSTKLIDRLLENGATVNAKDSNDMTPLYYAIVFKNDDLIRFILDKNADFVDNKFAFCFSFLNGNDNYTYSQIFVEHGFTLTMEDINDVLLTNKLFPFLKDKFKMAMFGNRLRDTLEKTTSSIEELNKLHLLYKFLISSIEKGFTDIVKNLLTPLVDVNIRMPTGLTMLHCAVIKGYLPIVENLLACEADVNALDESCKMSALHFSVRHQREEIATVLLKNNANTEIRDNSNLTPLDYTVRMDNYKIASLLLDAGANINPDNVQGTNQLLNVAANHKNLVLVKALLHFGAKVDYQDFLNFINSVNDCEDSEKFMNLVFNHNEVCNSDSSVVLKWKDFNRLSSKCKRLIIKYATFHGRVIDYHSSESKWCYFQIKCVEEIKKMKIMKIEGFSVTVDDVLRKRARKIARYLYNEDFVRGLEKIDFKTTFPLFESKIRAHVDKGGVTKRLLELSSTCFEDFLNWNLPMLVIDKILSYLDDQELRCLIFTLPIDDGKKAAVLYKDEDKVVDNDGDDDEED